MAGRADHQDKTDDECIKVILRRVRVTLVAVETH